MTTFSFAGDSVRAAKWRDDMSRALDRIKSHGTTVIGCAEAVDKISQQHDAALITEMLNILKLTKVWEECSKDMEDNTDSYFRCATEWLSETASQ